MVCGDVRAIVLQTPKLPASNFELNELALRGSCNSAPNYANNAIFSTLELIDQEILGSHSPVISHWGMPPKLHPN
jgi:hypothetical protein